MGRRRADTAHARGRRKGSVNPEPAATAGGAKVERQRRLIEVQRLILDGVDDERILAWLTTEITQADVERLAARGLIVLVKPWKVTDVTAREYLLAAQRPWAQKLAPDKAAARHILNRQRLLHQYELANRDGDRGAAIKAATAICELDGTYDERLGAGVGVEEDVDLDEAITEIDHAADMVALGRRRGVIPPALAAAAIDVEPAEATAAGADDQHPEVVDGTEGGEAKPPTPEVN